MHQWWIFGLILLVSSLANGCTFDDYTATCTASIAGVATKTKVVVNHCHDPVDVTFYVQSKEPLVEWQHTFVTTNDAESQEIAGFTEKVELHVKLTNVLPHEVLVQADYHTNNAGGNFFLDSTVRVGDTRDCLALAPVSESSIGGHIAAGLIISLVVVCLATTSTYLYYRHRRNALDRLALVDDVDAGLPGSSPYQEGPVTGTKKKTNSAARYSLKVEFRNGHNATGVVIENNFANAFGKTSVELHPTDQALCGR